MLLGTHLWPNMPVIEALTVERFCATEVPEMLFPSRVYFGFRNRTRSTT